MSARSVTPSRIVTATLRSNATGYWSAAKESPAEMKRITIAANWAAFFRIIAQASEERTMARKIIRLRTRSRAKRLLRSDFAECLWWRRKVGQFETEVPCVCGISQTGFVINGARANQLVNFTVK